MFDDDQSDEDEPQMFCEREDWQDVTPLEQYENMAPIAPIMYTPECESSSGCSRSCILILVGWVDKDATGYFRAIVKDGERSPRVLELTEAVIRLNPGHYSAWYVTFIHSKVQEIEPCIGSTVMIHS
jgi:protein farnesyltransferase/geranylgeranyltransferase type-1 subunit alpha